jgi:hypothetical protein
MAMTIFYLLNGLGVVFLLYVLANFWKEGQRPKNDARKDTAELGRRDWADVIVVTFPISHSAQGGLSVLPFPGRDRESDNSAHRTPSDGTPELTVRRSSTR